MKAYKNGKYVPVATGIRKQVHMEMAFGKTKAEALKLYGYSSDGELDLSIPGTRSPKIKTSPKPPKNRPVMTFVYRENDEIKHYPKTSNWKITDNPGKFLGFASNGEIIRVVKYPLSIDKTYAGTCCYCEEPLFKGDNYTKEHIVPVSRGGKGGSNIKPACSSCNNEKDRLLIQTYITVLEFKMLDLKPGTEEYERTKTKIKNANRLAKEIEEKRDF